MRGNLGHIWSFVIPPNPRWILLKKGEESLLYVTAIFRVSFSIGEIFFDVIFAAGQTTLE